MDAGKPSANIGLLSWLECGDGDIYLYGAYIYMVIYIYMGMGIYIYMGIDILTRIYIYIKSLFYLSPSIILYILNGANY